MQLKPLVAASLAVLASVSANASDTDWGVHDLLEAGYSVVGSLTRDTYSFSLLADSTLASTVASLGLMVPGTYGIFMPGADGMVNTADDMATPYAWNYGGAPTVHTVTLAAGDYYYAVNALGAPLGAYAIASATVVAAPVPEPETYAMLLAGLGVVGFLARRRRFN
jgi:hypothetical protein